MPRYEEERIVKNKILYPKDFSEFGRLFTVGIHSSAHKARFVCSKNLGFVNILFLSSFWHLEYRQAQFFNWGKFPNGQPDHSRILAIFRHLLGSFKCSNLHSNFQNRLDSER